MTIVRHIIDPATGQAFFVTPDNPSTIGLDGPIGSLANMAGGGRLFSKFGAAVTDWQEFAPVTTGGVVNSVFGRTGNVIAQSGDYTFAQIGSKPTTIGGYGITDFNSLGDARWLRSGIGSQVVPNLILSGNANPYVQFSDGTYTAYWQMTGGSMNLYHNGKSRLLALAGGGMQTFGTWTFINAANTDSLFQVADGDRVYSYLPINTQSHNIELGSGIVGYDNEVFTARGASVPHYGWRWTTTTDGDLNVRLLGGGYGGISLFTGGAERVRIGTTGGTTFYQGAVFNGVVEAQSATAGVMWWSRDDTANSNVRMMWYSSGGLARLWNANMGDLLQLNMASGGLELTVGGVGIPNGQGYYARRTTGNALIRAMGYDAGTDDLSTVIGGNIWRVRDTGAGIPMWLTAGGSLNVSNAYYLGDIVFAAFDSSYHRLYRRDGAVGIYLGGADPVNYYDNGAHFFRSRSGTNLLTLDGSNANFSANVRTGAFFLMDQMYGATLVGLYDPARFRGIYAMGTAYQMSADGSSLGSLYGLFFAYDAPGYQVVSGHTLSHGFGLAEAGVAKFFCGSTGMWHAGPAWFDGSVTAPLFKDTTTGASIAPVIVSTSAPSTSAPNGTLWIQVT